MSPSNDDPLLEIAYNIPPRARDWYPGIAGTKIVWRPDAFTKTKNDEVEGRFYVDGEADSA